MTDIVDRLRGIYRIPIADGLGATGGGEEPDNPNEFVRNFETPPIQKEAADHIERLRVASQFWKDNYHAENEEIGKLVAVLKEVMGWIDNWSPDFVYDEEWQTTRARVEGCIGEKE